MNSPIIIFTYNRIKHLQTLLESLKKNKSFETSKVIVFSDSQKDENEKRAIKLNFNKKENGNIIGRIFGNEEKCIDGFKKNKISLENLNLIKGYFNETVPKYIDKFNNIVILRLDADWYEATYFLLDNLYDKVVDGGLIIIDDFYAYIGCRKAVIDFFNNRKMNLPKIYHTKETGLTTITGGTEVFWYK